MNKRVIKIIRIHTHTKTKKKKPSTRPPRERLEIVRAANSKKPTRPMR